MMLLDEAAEPLLDDMGIDLRGRDVGVAEQLLHGAKVGAALKQMTGEGVAEHMRRYPRRLDPRFERERLELLAEALPRQMLGRVNSLTFRFRP
jgi:hypothetical protein